MVRKLVLVFILAWISVACAQATNNSLPTAVSTISLPTPTAQPTVNIPPTITPQILPTPTNPPLPTATAVLPKRLAVPPEFSTIALENWETIVDANPAALFEQAGVDAAIQLNGDGMLVWQSPLVLAVEWTEQWEMITWEEAQALIDSEDARVSLMPWREMPPTHKALWINGRSPADPDYPLQTRLTLLNQSDIPTNSIIAEIQKSLPNDPIIHLAAVGDLMLARRLGSAMQNGNIDYPFEKVAAHLQQADITVGNVESAVGQSGLPAEKSYPFLAPPETAVSLANAGFDVVSLANNHGVDFGESTLLSAIDLLKQQGIATIGAGDSLESATAPFMQTINGLTVAILAYVNVPVERSGFDTRDWTAAEGQAGLAWGDPEQIRRDVTAVSAQADITIVVLHSGFEYVPAPSPPQVAGSKAAIEAGADLVIGHHAHILQGVEFYQDGVIVYGLGNFAFDINGAPETAVLDVWLDQEGVRELRLTPAIVQVGGQPRFATSQESSDILSNVYYLTRLLNP